MMTTLTSRSCPYWRCHSFHIQKTARFLCAMAATTALTSALRPAGRTTEAFLVSPQQRMKRWHPPTIRPSCGVWSYSKCCLLSMRMSTSTASSHNAKMTHEERQMTDDALAIIREAIHAVDPQTAVQTHLKANPNYGVLEAVSPLDNIVHEYAAQDYDEIRIVAFGKASSAMAKATAERVREAMPNIPISGVVIVKDEHATREELEYLKRFNIEVREASHPVPDERSFRAAKGVMDLVSSSSERTLVICCISGGGSALFCYPKSEFLTLDDLQTTNACLLASGMTIRHINILRKRLEDGKGGRLAAVAYPATVLSLVLSDILGDPLDLIASGPTVPDSSTWEDAWQLVQKYNLEQGDYALPPPVLQLLKRGLDGEFEDTPTSEHPAFATMGRCETILVGNNELAVTAAAREAQRRGYHPVVLGTMIEGEARHVAGMYTAMAQQLACQRMESKAPFAIAPLPAALIGGGETTVTLAGSHGKGGRNQELALAAALQMKSLNLRKVVVASAGTDGTDGPTDAAGAVVDGGTVDRIPRSAEEALSNHDAYNYFSTDSSSLIMTGPTGTNVADVCVTLVR